MDTIAEARYQQLWRERGRRDDWRDLVGKLRVTARDDLDLTQSVTEGHEWYRLPSYDSYLAACSCGWRGVDTHHLGRMLRQVKNHLDAAAGPRLSRGNDEFSGTAVLGVP